MIGFRFEILVTSTEVGLKQFQPLWQINLLEVISRLLNAKVDVNSATITSQRYLKVRSWSHKQLKLTLTTSLATR